MPPPQCPECGRFLATAFVEQITTTAAPCPGCGIDLFLGEEDEDAGDTVAPEQAPPVPPPSATLPAQEAAGADGAIEDESGTAVQGSGEAAGGPAATEAPDGEETSVGDAPAVPPPAATLPDDVEPEPETSVRPPDLAGDRDPLEGWDQTRTVTAGAGEPDPVVLAAGAGIGALLGLLLGGPERRGLGALLGAVLGAVVARLRG